MKRVSSRELSSPILDQIEFTSDGTRDSLTGALAPARFLEVTRRELAIGVREGRAITLISVRFMAPELGENGNQSNYSIEDQLKNFTEFIQPLLRTGDQIGRISEDGFWILIRGDEGSAHRAIERFQSSGVEGNWRFRLCESQKGEDIKNLLRRMDLIHFAK